MLEWLPRFVRRFFQSENANVIIIFALSLFPIIFLVGLGMDFTAAAQKKAHLDAAADAAALSAVTPQMANQTIAATQAFAQKVFTGQASTMTGLSYSPPTINIVQNGLVRTATVSYTGSSTNAFSGILGKPTWPIAGYVDGDLAVLAKCRFLFAPRQFAIDGDCRDERWHQYHGFPHPSPGWLRLCLP